MISTDKNSEALFNLVADGIASEEDEQRLGEMLRSDPEARRAFREFMALHSALHWDYVSAVTPEQPVQTTPRVSSTDPRAGWLVAFVVGMVVAGVVALAVWRPLTSTTVEKATIPTVDENRGGMISENTTHTDLIAALLVDEVGAEFAPGRAPDGVRFGPGQYELLKGTVHLRFAQGADLVLAAPARLDVKDAQHIRLAYGKVRVTAPPTAKGFTVATRNADYVDLGTEFGLRVDSDSGASDLYVFDGQVNVADPRSGEVLSEVIEGESSRYVDGAIGVAPKLDGKDFPTPGAIGYQRWQHYEQQLRQDPGLLAFYPFRRMSDDSVLTNEVNQEAMAAGRIVGARWTTGRWPGKDALLFDRDIDFVELDIPGEHNELTIAAWVKVDRLDFVFNAILNSDGYDLGDLHFQLTRQGYPRGGVVVNGRFHDSVAGNSVPLGEWTHVVSVLSTTAHSQRIYVNGVLARERRWESDQVLRPGSCRLGNWLPAANIEPTTRAFRGRVDELAIWDRALNEDDVKKLVEAGRPGLLWNEQ